jgi:hypothetical protein
VKFIQGALWSLVLASAALAQTMPNCSFEPWVSTGGASALTVCSSTAICPTGNSPNASAAGGIALVGFGVPYACLTSNVEYIVRTADISTGHHYSLGIVCHSGDCTPGTLYSADRLSLQWIGRTGIHAIRPGNRQQGLATGCGMSDFTVRFARWHLRSCHRQRLHQRLRHSLRRQQYRRVLRLQCIQHGPRHSLGI